MKDTEIEIKVKLQKIKPLIGFLKKHAKFIGEKHQVDEYFVPAHRDFTSIRPVKEWLRLRSSSGEYSINYKNWHHGKDGKSHHCDEYETKIESLNQLKKVLKVLDFKSLTKVDKTRNIWNYKNYQISIDTVKKLGDFVEIEYIGKKKVSPKKATDEMVKFLKTLNCGKIERNYVGYIFQLLFPNEIKHEAQ